MVKNPLANAGDMGSVPDGEIPLAESMATHSSIPARRIPWMQKPGAWQPLGLQSCTQLKRWSMNAHTSKKLFRKKTVFYGGGDSLIGLNNHDHQNPFCIPTGYTIILHVCTSTLTALCSQVTEFSWWNQWNMAEWLSLPDWAKKTSLNMYPLCLLNHILTKWQFLREF